jgi:6,7-dimethyl-8-ribityllumazine synthase
MRADTFTGGSSGNGLRIGIVQARFNARVGDALLANCLAELGRLGVAEADMLVCTVPGALEVPFALARLGRSRQFDALIALGAVIKGDTYHFEVVCNESAAGVGRVMIDLGIPIANAILTTYTDDQADERAPVKGAEAARVAVEMANLGTMIDTIDAGDADV